MDLDSSAGTLTSADRDKLAEKLIFGAVSMPKNGICSFDKVRKLLGLPKSARFNFEATEKGIKCDTTSQIMASDACFGEKWYKLDNADTDKIIEKILQAQDDEEIISFLKENYALSDTAAREALVYLFAQPAVSHIQHPVETYRSVAYGTAVYKRNSVLSPLYERRRTYYQLSRKYPKRRVFCHAHSRQRVGLCAG